MFCTETSSVVPGTLVVYAIDPLYACPIGHLYYRSVLKDKLEIMHVFTVFEQRRKGVASKMLDYLRMKNLSDTMVTQQGSADGGEAWLVSNGFKQREDGWWLPSCEAIAKAAAVGKPALVAGKRGGK